MKDRETLRSYFKKGKIPSEAEFEHLIDSGINKIDDGFSKTWNDGLMISSLGGTENLISFYESIDADAQWVIKIKKDGIVNNDKNELQIRDSENENPLLSLNKRSRVGINVTNPQRELDVNGWISSKGRLGSYGMESTVPADGSWYAITPVLDYCQAFEIVARTGIKDSGKHAILHAVAVSAYGNSCSSIRKTRGYYNFWQPVKLQLRWTGSTHAYQLQIRCKKNLGSDVLIKYFITHLWSDEEMAIEKQFLDTQGTPSQ